MLKFDEIEYDLSDYGIKPKLRFEYHEKRPYKHSSVVDRTFKLFYGKKGLIPIAANSCRLAFFLNQKYIIKVDWEALEYGEQELHCNCWNQTKAEVKAVEQIEKQDQKYFPTLIAYDLIQAGHAWAIFRRHFPMEGEISQRNKTIIKDLCSKYGISDVSPEHKHNCFVDKKTKLPLIYDLGLSRDDTYYY